MADQLCPTVFRRFVVVALWTGPSLVGSARANGTQGHMSPHVLGLDCGSSSAITPACHRFYFWFTLINSVQWEVCKARREVNVEKGKKCFPTGLHHHQPYDNFHPLDSKTVICSSWVLTELWVSAASNSRTPQTTMKHEMRWREGLSTEKQSAGSVSPLSIVARKMTFVAGIELCLLESARLITLAHHSAAISEELSIKSGQRLCRQHLN